MRIMIATDGSGYGNAAVNFAAELAAKGTGDEFKVISIIEPAVGTEVEMMVVASDELLDLHNEAFQDAQDSVKASAEALRHAGAANVSSEVFSGMAASRIVDAAAAWNADLIILGTHGRGFWSRALLGSVSDRVMHHAHCSVLIVRKPGDVATG